jgi:membrane protease YdiL (CAAX protease family)
MFILMVFWRLCVSLAAAILPLIFINKGIYGSFLLTFSIPVIWELGLRARSADSLGLKARSIGPSAAAGAISGCLLGGLSGILLRFFGMTGYAYAAQHQFRISLGIFNVAFSLRNEAGYRLLILSGTPPGALLYFAFSVFVIGLGEEIFWRGFIQKKMSGYFTATAAVWITAVLFALSHFYIFAVLSPGAGILFLALTALGGAIWGYLFRRFDNIWSAAVSHGITAFILWKYFFFRGLLTNG